MEQFYCPSYRKFYRDNLFLLLFYIILDKNKKKMLAYKDKAKGVSDLYELFYVPRKTLSKI